jgi:hypothetical protein
MHSHDRTLASQILNDSDRKTHRHELACIYVKEHAYDLVDKLMHIYSGEWDCQIPGHIQANIESHLMKGEGRYSVTVGFVDVTVSCVVREDGSSIPANIAVEVKTQETPISDCIRQIKLYKKYQDSLDFQYGNGQIDWFLITDYKISKTEHSILWNEGIFHACLGEMFQQWIDENRHRLPNRSKVKPSRFSD